MCRSRESSARSTNRLKVVNHLARGRVLHIQTIPAVCDTDLADRPNHTETADPGYCQPTDKPTSQLVQTSTPASGCTINPKTTSTAGRPRLAGDHPAKLRKRRTGVAEFSGFDWKPYYHHVAHTPDVKSMYVPNISTDQLPRWMADDDHRGRVVDS